MGNLMLAICVYLALRVSQGHPNASLHCSALSSHPIPRLRIVIFSDSHVCLSNEIWSDYWRFLVCEAISVDACPGLGCFHLIKGMQHSLKLMYPGSYFTSLSTDLSRNWTSLPPQPIWLVNICIWPEMAPFLMYSCCFSTLQHWISFCNGFGKFSHLYITLSSLFSLAVRLRFLLSRVPCLEGIVSSQPVNSISASIWDSNFNAQHLISFMGKAVTLDDINVLAKLSILTVSDEKKSSGSGHANITRN